TISQSSAATFTKRVIHQLDPDNTFIKLVFAILTFSTINYTIYRKNVHTNFINITQTLLVQDMYTDVTWRYLLYKYGYHQAVIRFSNLLRCLFTVTAAVVEAHESEKFTEMIDSVIEQTEQTLCL
ncbi:unnamed protein product, partial [Rotaria sp. Silwood2]